MPRKAAEDGPSLAPATSVENSHKDPGPWLQPDSGLATVSIYGGEQTNAESSPVTAGASSLTILYPNSLSSCIPNK